MTVTENIVYGLRLRKMDRDNHRQETRGDPGHDKLEGAGASATPANCPAHVPGRRDLEPRSHVPRTLMPDLDAQIRATRSRSKSAALLCPPDSSPG